MSVNSPQRTAQRRQNLQEQLDKENIPALLVTNLKNVRYLTGFTGSNAAVLIPVHGEPIFVTDGRYTTQVATQVPDIDAVIQGGDPALTIAAKSDQDFAVESDISYLTAQKLGNPHSVDGVVEKLRIRKDDAEIESLLAAGQMADAVFVEFINAGGIRESITEHQAAAELEYRLRLAGADSLSFDTILASGTNASKPHAGVSNDPLVPGLITLDFGIYLDGYASDQTRALSIGQLDGIQREIYDIERAAFNAAESLLAPGISAFAIDKAARDIIDQAGFGEYFVHSTGHGVGLDVHEAPNASKVSNPESLLEQGMTLTVEPGIYIPEKTGIRIENSYVITESGAQCANPSSTELYVV